jgi:hypothetical protein
VGAVTFDTAITTLGTIGTGVWQGTAIADAYIASAATWNAPWDVFTYNHSIAHTADWIYLVGDDATPGNSKLYGTNGSGTKGWYDQPGALPQPLDTTDSPTFAKVKTAAIYPASDGTTAVQIEKADASTVVVNVDTTNARVGINDTSPSYSLDVTGTAQITGAVTLGSTVTVTGLLTASAKVKTAAIYPASDSTTAVQIQKANGTTGVIFIDTTNGRLGINNTPTVALDIDGPIRMRS